MTLEEITVWLETRRNPENLAGMARFGINVERAFGIPLQELRLLSKRIGKNHVLAGRLWSTGLHEARLLAMLIEDPASLSNKQMERWVRDFDSWDLCDGCCIHLFRKTPNAYERAIEWTKSEREFVKRAGFALIATLAVHARRTDDAYFLECLERVGHASGDERNFVRKAVNWALRQIGKRNLFLHDAALKCARELAASEAKSARWIGKDALRELSDEKIIRRIKK
jgi:3-methyladenine DNA glycosylase AlkD